MKFILTLCLIGLLSPLFSFSITENNKPNAVIVVADDATAPEKNAGNELAKYINKISGVELEIVNTPSKNTNNIYIGQTDLTKKILGDNFNWKKLKDDGIVIKSGKNYLVLAGDRPRGSLYAVYTFLEDNLGCRYWAPDDEYIPNIKTIKINNLNTVYTPPFMSRESYFNVNIANPDYAVKLKLNGHFNKIPDDMGGHIELVGWCHTFTTLISTEEYGKNHPEYFAFRDGKRTITGHDQLCLSNQDMVKELTKNVLKKIAENPNIKLISVSQADNENYCTCDACKALTEKYGHSGALLTVINQVAKAVKEKYPDMYVETLAYQYTRQAPKNIKPADNIIIRLCTIECDFSTPLDSDTNKTFYKDLTDWKKVAKNLYIWDYVVNFSNYHIVHPNFQSLQKNLQIFANNNAKAVFEQGDSFNPNVTLVRLKGWLLAKLLWNPNLNYDKATKEYLNGYYGAAGENMYKYLKICTKAVEREHFNLTCFVETGNPYFTANDYIDAFTALNNALKKVDNNPKLKNRVLCDLYSFQVGWLLANKDIQKKVADSNVIEYKSPIKFINMYNKFAKKNGNYQFRESRSVDDSILASQDIVKKEGTVPELCKNLPDNKWVDLQENTFTFLFNEGFSRIVDDPQASNGKAIFMSSFHIQWSVQKMLSFLYLDDTYDYGDLYAVYRVEPNKKTGKAYEIGVYNETAKYLFAYDIKSDDTPDNKYITKYIGRVPYKTTTNLSYIYICPMGDEDLSKGLYLDRIFIIQGNN